MTVRVGPALGRRPLYRSHKPGKQVPLLRAGRLEAQSTPQLAALVAADWSPGGTVGTKRVGVLGGSVGPQNGAWKALSGKQRSLGASPLSAVGLLMRVGLGQES